MVIGQLLTVANEVSQRRGKAWLLPAGVCSIEGRVDGRHMQITCSKKIGLELYSGRTVRSRSGTVEYLVRGEIWMGVGVPRPIIQWSSAIVPCIEKLHRRKAIVEEDRDSTAED